MNHADTRHSDVCATSVYASQCAGARAPALAHYSAARLRVSERTKRTLNICSNINTYRKTDRHTHTHLLTHLPACAIENGIKSQSRADVNLEHMSQQKAAAYRILQYCTHKHTYLDNKCTCAKRHLSGCRRHSVHASRVPDAMLCTTNH